MYSLITPYLSKTVITITGIVACAIGVATFGNALVFDRMFLALLLFTATFSFFRDKNTFTIFGVLIAVILIEEALWYIRQETYLFKLILYSSGLFIVYKLRYDTYSKIAGVALIVVIMAELFWWLTNYPPPTMVWGTIMLIMPVVIRHFIFFRPAYVARLVPHWKEIEWINTDYQIYQIAIARIILEIAKTAEYLVRHVLDLKDILIVYHSYTYIVHAINCYMLWVILNESIRVIQKKQISA